MISSQLFGKSHIHALRGRLFWEVSWDTIKGAGGSYWLELTDHNQLPGERRLE